MSDEPQKPPKIEFPCPNYPVKVMGNAGAALHTTVLEVFHRHAPGFDAEAITVRDSAKGTFQSITVFIVATGEDQLRAIHEDLRASGLVKMVL